MFRASSRSAREGEADVSHAGPELGLTVLTKGLIREQSWLLIITIPVAASGFSLVFII